MRIAFLLALALSLGSALDAQSIAAPFSDDYELVDLGAPPGVLPNLGGLTLRREEPNTLYIVGAATQPGAGVYRIGITRGPKGHIVGFEGVGALHATAPHADGGLDFGRRGVLFFTRYNMNHLGQIRPGSTGMDKSVELFPLGVLPSVGGLSFIPRGFPRAGDLALSSILVNRTYTVELAPDGMGTFDVVGVTDGVTLNGGIEGYAFIPPRSPQFTAFEHVLICEWGTGEVVTYELDVLGDPDPSTRRVFLENLPSCIGLALDQISGDLLISTYGGTTPAANHVFAIRGFGAPRIRQAEGPSATVPWILR